MSLICSNTEPGHPCVMMTGIAFGWRDLIWKKWMSTSSILVMNCGKPFSFASPLRQSYWVPPVAQEFLEVREPRALRRIGDGFFIGPSRPEDPSPEIGERPLRDIDVERVDCAILAG